MTTGYSGKLVATASVIAGTRAGAYNKKAVLPKGNRAMPQLFLIVSLKFAVSIQYKYKSNQTLKTRLQSSKHTGAKQNLTRNGHSTTFKVTC